MTGRVLEHVVADEDAGARADVVIGRRVAGVSRRAARALALAGALRSDGRVLAPSHRVRAGERLQLALAAEAAPPSLVVLATTERFVYVDKPAGVHTHRLRPDDPPALADAVTAAFAECADAGEDPREGGAIARLDRATTGVLAFARTREAWVAGRAAMSRSDTHKRYVALCRCPSPASWPPPGVRGLEPSPALDWSLPAGLPQPQSLSPVRLRLQLGHGAQRGSVAVRSDGRPTVCDVLPLALSARVQPDGHARLLVAVALGRGYRHQIRVHLAWLGLPIEGDLRYGGGPGTIALHCASIDLSASCPGEQRVAAPLPAALAARLAALSLRPWAAPNATW